MKSRIDWKRLGNAILITLMFILGISIVIGIIAGIIFLLPKWADIVLAMTAAFGAFVFMIYKALE